ncbi:MAG: hypothetical protein ITG04_06460 [Proteiniphilum sp.]|jgi:Flp pilus assembly protein TadB|nr:hypothetical protein [Proteiniphilum sp.]
MTIQQRAHSYKVLADDCEQRINRLGKQIYLIGTVRLVLFVAAVIMVFMLVHHLNLLALLLLFTFVLFILLMKKHNQLLEKKETKEFLYHIAVNELKAFDHDFSAFDGAPEKTDPSHTFSFDLDIFGEKSVFQQINRTVLSIGRETLAEMMLSPLTEKEAIEKRQEAIRELSDNEDFSFRFRVTGMKTASSDLGKEDYLPVSKPGKRLHHSLFWKVAVWVTPLIYVIYAVLWLTNLLPGSLFIYLYLFTLMLSLIPFKRVKETWLLVDKRSKRLNAYADLLKMVEEERPESDQLLTLQKRLTLHKNASQVIKELSGYSHNLDLGFTIAILFLNPLLLWTTRYTLKIEQWMKSHGDHVDGWFKVLAEMDALISAGTFAMNHPDYTYPVVSDSYCFIGDSMGHPLIPRDQCVKNDIEISRRSYFMIVTGANMAGKSTYLRTIGVNHVMASVGLPVWARRMVFYPGSLLTNLRTADSLVNNESYFFAELKRLKMIIDRLEAGEEGLLIILDEILKGTNSEDKKKGSLALVKRLISLRGNGIIATHDLSLGNMENVYPQQIKNYHFDAIIKNDLLTFDYQIQEGIAINMNASFLMKKMGITE